MLHFRPDRSLRGVYCFPINQSQQFKLIDSPSCHREVTQINVGNYEGKSWVLICV